MKQLIFNELPLTDKAILVAEFGTLVTSIEFYDYWVHLYTLNNNFIEVYYNMQTRQIDRITLATYDEIDKFILNVDLRNLVE
jgi:uncharacterized protein YggT (Ycf19 family)